MRKTVFCFGSLIGVWTFSLFHNSVWAFDMLPQYITSYTYTAELKPISTSFQTARSTFLPDRFEDLGFSNYDTLDDDYNRYNCSGYTLSACPNQGLCSACPFDAGLFKLQSCNAGFTRHGNSCLLQDCSTIGYLAEVPSGKVCTSVNQGGLTCYKDCRAPSCSGYTLSCSDKPENAAALVKCPDCTTNASNCGDNICKISQCNSGYKIANNGTTCLALDDTCPNGYYKFCETSTQGAPVFTEAGTACYQCKPKVLSCPSGQLNLDTYWCNAALRCVLPQTN